MKNPSLKSKNTFNFTWELGKALTLSWIRERYGKPSFGLLSGVKAEMRHDPKIVEVPPVPL